VYVRGRRWSSVIGRTVWRGGRTRGGARRGSNAVYPSFPRALRRCDPSTPFGGFCFSRMKNLQILWKSACRPPATSTSTPRYGKAFTTPFFFPRAHTVRPNRIELVRLMVQRPELRRSPRLLLLCLRGYLSILRPRPFLSFPFFLLETGSSKKNMCVHNSQQEH
jgi:hypothetical protein